MESELGEIGGEAGFGAGDAEIGGHRKAEAAADGRALHSGDDRLPGAEDSHRLDIEVIDLAEAVGRVAAVGFLAAGIVEIGAGAERLALRRQHHRANVDVVVELVERIGDLVDEGDIEEVQRRALDFDGDDMAGLLDADIGEFAHAGS